MDIRDRVQEFLNEAVQSFPEAGTFRVIDADADATYQKRGSSKRNGFVKLLTYKATCDWIPPEDSPEEIERFNVGNTINWTDDVHHEYIVSLAVLNHQRDAAIKRNIRDLLQKAEDDTENGTAEQNEEQPAVGEGRSNQDNGISGEDGPDSSRDGEAERAA